MRHVEEQEQERRETDRAFLRKCAIWFVVILFVIFCFVMRPTFFRSYSIPADVRTLSNSKQVYLYLLDYESDYGHFPDSVMFASQIDDRYYFHGSFSNDYLGKLIAGGYTTNEEIFYAYDKRYGSERADLVITPPSCILEKNECGFSYVMVQEKGKTRGLSTKDDGSLPILAAPLVNEWGSFEKKSYNGKGVYLRVDGAARSERLRAADQKIELSPSRQTLFDSGPGTIWGNLKPVVLLPER
jgi:hypothetical protein